MWQQGAALLTWGFSVAATQGPGVGRLVEPGEVTSPPTRPAPAPTDPVALAAGDTAASGGVTGEALGLAGAGLAGLIILAWLVLLIVGHRRRTRSDGSR